ncbi:unnamed protein product [Vitrella brassicaformis CCMP3155]|uniref:Uncharacterized protein n=1 Tax=Vitrella brassicaformis (strain CCMP3155) TaxID=1169540 RepID=A0A0G4GL44_VITBC|nr:unnamed protein product [Vitrella brassicaformis CCMP3155]|eukprot:CEM30751.1 unnamed protein product [Vitrella brassicaformis CCMP3155]
MRTLHTLTTQTSPFPTTYVKPLSVANYDVYSNMLSACSETLEQHDNINATTAAYHCDELEDCRFFTLRPSEETTTFGQVQFCSGRLHHHYHPGAVTALKLKEKMERGVNRSERPPCALRGPIRSDRGDHPTRIRLVTFADQS